MLGTCMGVVMCLDGMGVKVVIWTMNASMCVFECVHGVRVCVEM